jgi:helicase
MRVDELELDAELLSILSESGITKLYPTQCTAIPEVLAGKNVVASIPTASGKSLIGYIALLRAFRQRNKGLYVVPLKALANEKYQELKVFEKAGMRLALSTGDYDKSGETLANKDVIIATCEKADSLLRHNAAWIRSISTLVVDEVHLINDPSRGPTVEMVISKLRKLNPGIQIVALSATIKNSAEIAKWLDAVHIHSDWRPVPLKQGVYCDGTVFFTDNSIVTVDEDEDELWALIKRSVLGGGQVLVFVNTRKGAENAAMKYRARMREITGELHERLEEDVEEASQLSEKINSCVECGVAFHHAGLTASQRGFIERMFKEGKIKCLFATPTLAAGINLPARTVIVRDIHRYSGNAGMSFIPVMEIRQMCGRAGRPKYDREGEAIIFARNREMAELILDEYLLGETESVFSQIGNERAIRTHVLSSIASRLCQTEEELTSFFNSTFCGMQLSREEIELSIRKALDFLQREHMIVEEGGTYRATLFGRRVSDLYLDPESAIILRKALALYVPEAVLGLLHAVCSTPDLMPVFISQSEIEEYVDIADARRKELIFRLEDAEDPERYLSELKTAMILLDWISEEDEEKILERYNIYPGDLREKCESARWLINSTKELAALLNNEYTESIERLAMRMEKGVSERLLDLASLKGIGRKRAKMLFLHGYRSRMDLRDADVEELKKVPGIGKEIAISIIKQCQGRIRTVKSEERNRYEWF